jgi:hypothetical protein
MRSTRTSERRAANPDESESLKRARDMYYAPQARIIRHQKFFADLRAKRYRMKALLGPVVDGPFDEIASILIEIAVSAGMLIQTASADEDAQDVSHRRVHEERIWETSRTDEISKRAAAAVAKIEEICRPLLLHHGPLDEARSKLSG